MTIAAGPRLQAAEMLIARFAAAGRPARSKDAAAMRKSADALQRSPVGWHATRDALVLALRRRLSGKDLPRQLGTSYCGPAAFLYCLLEDRPDLYVAYALSLWLRGDYDFRSPAGGMDVDSDAAVRASIDKARAAEPRRSFISDLDWMTMAPLSASTRPMASRIFGTPSPDDQAGSISYPGVVREWFAAAGATCRADTMGLGLMKSGPAATLKLLEHWANSWIVLQIDSSLISAGTPNTFQRRHWVVVNPHRRPLVKVAGSGRIVPLADAMRHGDGSDMTAWQTSLYTVSWGNESTPLQNTQLGHLAGRIYGGFAFSRFR